MGGKSDIPALMIVWYTTAAIMCPQDAIESLQEAYMYMHTTNW